jgi:hypothetical protein
MMGSSGRRIRRSALRTERLWSSQVSLTDESTRKNPGSRPLRREKREEALMDGGCLSHATALAIDSLSLHLRYILEDIYANNLM